MTEGLELAQPAGEDKRNAVQRQLGVNAEQVFGLALGEVFLGVEPQAALEFRKRSAGRAKPMAKAWPPKRVKRSAQLSMALRSWKPSTERPEPWATPSSTLTTMAGLAVRSTTREARMPMTPRCQPSPSMTKQPVCGELGVFGKAGFDGGECGGFGLAAFAVEALELGGQFGGAGPVTGGEELDHIRGHVHASGGVDARRKTEGYIEAGDGARGWIECRGGKEGAQAEARRAAQLAQTKRGDDAVFALERHGVSDGGDGGHFEKAGQCLFAGAGWVAAFQNGLRQLQSDGSAAEEFFWIFAVRADSD